MTRSARPAWHAERAVRSVAGSVLECAFCGRSAADQRAGTTVCERCRGELAPTKLRQWVACLGFSPAEVATWAGVSVPTLRRALRGEPMGARSAAKLSKLTKIDVTLLRAGEPSPLQRAK